MKQRVATIEQWLIRSLCAIALLFVGFAHQVPAAETTDFSAYALPDGTLPTLCVTVSDDNGRQSSDHKMHSQGCEACRIGASVLLPVPGDIAGVPVTFAVLPALPLRVEALHRQIYPPNTGPRAPPSDFPVA